MRKWLYGAHLAKKVDMLSTYAGALAYGLVLSVVPFLVVAFALTSELVGSLNSWTYEETLARVLPLGSDSHFVNHLVVALETSWHSALAKMIGLLFAVYTSFNLMNQIVRTLLFIFDDSRKPFQWTWRVFSKALALLAVWTFLLLTITVSSVLSIFVHRNVHFLAMPWHVVSILLMIGSLFGAVFVTYYLVPGKRPHMRDVRDGALVASLGWIGCGLFFTQVIPRLIGMNLVYQALGSIVIILLWAQACAWSLIIGACWMVRFAQRSRR